MIVVIDYGAGNLYSVASTLSRLGVNYTVSSNIDTIKSATKVILPGVGAARKAMDELRKCNLVDVIRSLKQPLLGICLGMQLLCEFSEEGNTECLGLIPVRVSKMTATPDNKVPHMGWNNIQNLKGALFTGISEGAYVYYVHSYGVPVCPYTICTSNHSSAFSGAIQFNNFYGCQFHPEKSGSTGAAILKNFLDL